MPNHNQLSPATVEVIERLKAQAIELREKIPTNFFKRLLDNQIMDLEHIPKMAVRLDNPALRQQFLVTMLGMTESHIQQAQKAWDTYGEQLQVIPDDDY
jgi:hypothetical protein